VLYLYGDYDCVEYFPTVHKHKQYFNWFIVMYTEHYFQYNIFQGKV